MRLTHSPSLPIASPLFLPLLPTHVVADLLAPPRRPLTPSLTAVSESSTTVAHIDYVEPFKLRSPSAGASVVFLLESPPPFDDKSGASKPPRARCPPLPDHNASGPRWTKSTTPLRTTPAPPPVTATTRHRAARRAHRRPAGPYAAARARASLPCPAARASPPLAVARSPSAAAAPSARASAPSFLPAAEPDRLPPPEPIAGDLAARCLHAISGRPSGDPDPVAAGSGLPGPVPDYSGRRRLGSGKIHRRVGFRANARIAI
nr:verprolin-like [Aegilops tauschii subsp. strangulata]